MQAEASTDTAAALEQFARAQFVNRRALIWPAQAAGISRLREGSSFALCTPNGSGKTTVATLAMIPALFEPNPNVPT
jgi:Lhr-like helicase